MKKIHNLINFIIILLALSRIVFHLVSPWYKYFLYFCVIISISLSIKFYYDKRKV
jgi:hypothetical protein